MTKNVDSDERKVGKILGELGRANRKNIFYDKTIFYKSKILKNKNLLKIEKRMDCFHTYRDLISEIAYPKVSKNKIFLL